MRTITVATTEAQKGFYPTPPALAEKLVGLAPEPEALLAALQGISVETFFMGLNKETFVDILTQ